MLALLFRLIAFIDGRSQRFQFLMLVRLHRLEIHMPHGVGHGESVSTLRHGVRPIGMSRQVRNNFLVQICPITYRLKSLGDCGQMSGSRPRRGEDPALRPRSTPVVKHHLHAITHGDKTPSLLRLAVRTQIRRSSQRMFSIVIENTSSGRIPLSCIMNRVY